MEDNCLEDGLETDGLRATLNKWRWMVQMIFHFKWVSFVGAKCIKMSIFRGVSHLKLVLEYSFLHIIPGPELQDVPCNFPGCKGCHQKATSRVDPHICYD